MYILYFLCFDFDFSNCFELKLEQSGFCPDKRAVLVPGVRIRNSSRQKNNQA